MFRKRFFGGLFLFSLSVLLILPTESVRAKQEPQGNGGGAPVWLTANELSLATGNPSLTLMSNGSTHVPVWSMSGGTVGQSVCGVIPGFSAGYAGIQVEIVVTTTDPQTSPKFEDVFRVHLSQLAPNASFAARQVTCTPVRTKLPDAPFLTRTILLESWYSVEPNIPITVRIQREPDDPADTFTRPVGLVMVKVTPLVAPESNRIVENRPGYNSWPVIQSLGNKLVAVYSRGTAHSIGEDVRAVYARTSEDEGKTWTGETLVANTPGWGEVTIGKGLDNDGAMLLWVRRVGKGTEHDLYRSTDGIAFTLISTPKLDPMPMQITDVFAVESVGLMALWFAGNYKDGEQTSSWGTVVSKDNGATWTQRVVESELDKSEWPTEQSAVYLGDGKILAIARTEIGDMTTQRAQFQLTSTDYGQTWTRTRTNIGEVMASTPSLIWDKQTGLLSNYYYERGRGVLRRRVVKPETVFENPLAWSDSEAVGLGSPVTFDAGNVNAVVLGNKHALGFYSGAGAQTDVVVTIVPKPE